MLEGGTGVASSTLAESASVIALPSTPTDEAAFRAVYDATARALWGYLYRTTGSAPDADDLVQDVFLRYLKAPLPTRDPAENRAYLFRIASNLAIDHWRRRGRADRHTAGPLDEVGPDLAPAASHERAATLRADLAKTFRELKPRERTILWLACVEGEAPADIARTLGVGRQSVPVLLSRARKKLARLLRRAGWEG